MLSPVVIRYLQFKRLCAGDIDEHINIFLDIQASKDALIKSGIEIFQYIYHALGTPLSSIRYNLFSRKAAAGLIKPETLPPTEGAAAQHSLSTYPLRSFTPSCGGGG